MIKATTEIINSQRTVSITRRQKQLLADTVNAVLAFEKTEVPCEVAIMLVSGAKIKKMNKAFREIDSETDVLSFPSGDYPPENKDVPCNLGDIALNLGRADAQAKEYGHSFEREIAFLTAHSVLHLLGYDHMTEEDEIVMFAKQEAVLASMGLTR